MPTIALDARRGADSPAMAAGRRGFSLVEVMCATGLGGILMAAILSSFLMLGRSGSNLTNYTTMEQQARVGLERFGEDVRMARFLTTLSASQVALTIPQVGSNANDTVYYSYDATAKTFSRRGPDPVTGAANTTTVLIRDVGSCEFKRWQLGSTGPANSDAATDQLQIRLTIQKAPAATVAATNVVVSARFVMRNHRTNTSL